jgi:DNA-binding winged helix-turn-helix (wHTH) protein/tetratricopeptide (TPR) repeat protein
VSFTLGEFRVEPSLLRISKGGESRRVEPKVMELLLLLASQPGKVFSKEEISERLWPGIFVSESSLFRHVSELRRLLGDERSRPRYVATIPKRGYRLVASLSPPGSARGRSSMRLLRVAALVSASGLVLSTISSRTSYPPVSPEAYAAFLKGDLYENRIDCGSFERSLVAYREATTLDAAFVKAYPKLLEALIATAVLGCQPPGPLFDEVEALLARARENGLDWAQYEAGAGALAFWRDRDVEEALQRFRAGGEAPDLSHAMALVASGRKEEAVGEARRALAELPVDLGENWAMGGVLYFAGRHSEAIEQFHATLELYPDFRPAMQLLALSYWMTGDGKAALDLAERSEPSEGSRLNRFDAVPGYIFAAAGRTERARGILATWEKRAESEWVPRTSLALLHLVLGERDAAERWLEESRREGDPWLVLVSRDPAFRPFLGRTASVPSHRE